MPEVKICKARVYNVKQPIDNLIAFIGLQATVFIVASTVPQIKKAVKTKDTEDVSIRFLLILIAGLAIWSICGIGRADIVILIGNYVGTSLNIWLLVLNVKYPREALKEQ